MDLLWPGFLVLLALIPLIIAAYIFIQRRRRRTVVRYSSLSLVRDALPKYSRLKRYLPFALFLVGLAGLVTALARPVSIVTVPTNQTTIILSMDVSRSMCSTDIEPNRLRAAQAAALAFIDGQKPGTQIGLVAFSGFSEIIQMPTTDRETLRSAVQSLITGRRTAIGSGILKAIDAIAEIDPAVAPSVTYENGNIEPPPVPKGAYVPHIIVLLTDGASNAGPMPTEAAEQALNRGIRVYTIGFGTARGSEIPNCSPGYAGNEPAGGFGGCGGGGGGGRFRRGIDEDTLKEVAAMTDAEYYSAESTDELVKAFQNLPTYLIAKHEVTEVSFAFAGVGAALITLAIVLGMLWSPLP